MVMVGNLERYSPACSVRKLEQPTKPMALCRNGDRATGSSTTLAIVDIGLGDVEFEHNASLAIDHLGLVSAEKRFTAPSKPTSFAVPWA